MTQEQHPSASQEIQEARPPRPYRTAKRGPGQNEEFVNMHQLMAFGVVAQLMAATGREFGCAYEDEWFGEEGRDQVIWAMVELTEATLPQIRLPFREGFDVPESPRPAFLAAIRDGLDKLLPQHPSDPYLLSLRAVCRVLYAEDPADGRAAILDALRHCAEHIGRLDDLPAPSPRRYKSTKPRRRRQRRS